MPGCKIHQRQWRRTFSLILPDTPVAVGRWHLHDTSRCAGPADGDQQVGRICPIARRTRGLRPSRVQRAHRQLDLCGGNHWRRCHGYRRVQSGRQAIYVIAAIMTPSIETAEPFSGYEFAGIVTVLEG